MGKNSSEQIYQNPENYDLEHSQPEPDVGFFCRLARRHKPARVLELACGNGRITVPLAAEVHRWAGEVVGLDSSLKMVEAARRRPSPENVTWIEGDVRDWRDKNGGFDLIVCPCSSLSHLLALEDHLSAWQNAFHNLRAGGFFVVAEQMANLPTIAESCIVPPRILLEIDNDTERPASEGRPVERLVRYRATRYFAHQQRATVRFLYDKMRSESEVSERFLSDYECHVFFPRELRLLYIFAGFQMHAVWGDYQSGPFTEHSRVMILSGLRPS